jgi:pSer/pThr/pTyr-binding forkhead associated (FHA) protein
MSKECQTCGYEANPDDAEFCETCGAELGNTFNSPAVSVTSPPPPLSPVTPPSPPMTPPGGMMPPPPVSAPPIAPPSSAPISSQTPFSPPVAPSPVTSIPSPVVTPSFGSSTTARLVAKLPNAPVPEFAINNYVSVGIFTPESGPVDIDLEQFPGSDTISKQHAEIEFQNGVWTIKDQSTNGTFIKPIGQNRFGPRIMAPTPLNSGDEIAFAQVIFIFQSP